MCSCSLFCCSKACLPGSVLFPVLVWKSHLLPLCVCVALSLLISLLFFLLVLSFNPCPLPLLVCVFGYFKVFFPSFIYVSRHECGIVSFLVFSHFWAAPLQWCCSVSVQQPHQMLSVTFSWCRSMVYWPRRQFYGGVIKPDWQLAEQVLQYHHRQTN